MEYALCSLGHGRTTILLAHISAGTIRLTKATTTTLTRRNFQLSSNRLIISKFNFSSYIYRNGLNPITRPNVVACFASNDRVGLESCDNDYLDREKSMVNVMRTIVLASVVGLISLGFGNHKALSVPPRGETYTTEGKCAKDLKPFNWKSNPFNWKTHDKSEQPNSPSKEAVDELKVKKLKSGNADKAVNELAPQFEMWKGESEPAFNIAMALIPILINMGRYTDALKYVTFIEEQKYNPPTDRDTPYTLYKAIIYTVLSEDDENKRIALECWKKFMKTMFEVSKAASPPSDG